MIYMVNGIEGTPTYFDESVNPNAKADAEAFLKEKREEALSKEAVRFSICATFVNGMDTTWRVIEESDPEDTVCQVFDHVVGVYTEVPNKTEAIALNEQRKQEFLASIALDRVFDLTELPTVVSSPNLEQRYGPVAGTIPVEIM